MYGGPRTEALVTAAASPHTVSVCRFPCIATPRVCVAVALAVCATGIYAEEARVLNALNYPLCQV